jgi:hypothetical protein
MSHPRVAPQADVRPQNIIETLAVAAKGKAERHARVSVTMRHRVDN